MKTTLDNPEDHTCGTCKHYEDYDLIPCNCMLHPEYGELVEKDTCKDWEEDDNTISK